MFDYSLAHWLTFAGAGLALEFTPGPSMLYMLGQTARHRRVHGLLLALAGLCDAPLVLIGARLTRWFKGRRRLSVWAERGVGAIFISLGVRLAAAHR